MAICNIVDNQLTVSDLLLEAEKPGIVPEVAVGIPDEDLDLEVSVLSEDETIAVLAAIAKTVDQPTDEVSEDGVGEYGLSLENLISVGVVKPGLGVSTDPVDLPVVLADPSVFTGKDGVVALIDLFENAPLQRELVIGAMNNNMIELSELGQISTSLTTDEMAETASLTTQFSLDDIKTKQSNPDLLNPVLLSEMIGIGVLAVSAIKMLTKKLNKKKKESAQATDTLKTPGLDAEAKKIVGSKRI